MKIDVEKIKTASAGMSDEINNPLVKLFALAITNKIKANLKDRKHGTDN